MRGNYGTEFFDLKNDLDKVRSFVVHLSEYVTTAYGIQHWECWTVRAILG